jgi:hypothetical protein
MKHRSTVITGNREKLDLHPDLNSIIREKSDNITYLRPARSDLNPDQCNCGILKHRENLPVRLRVKTSMREKRMKDKEEDRTAKRQLAT